MNQQILVLACLLFPSLAPAQRTSADLPWKKHDIAIEYGAVRVGKHSLDELAVGSTWRMGMNTASIIRLDAPLRSGDAVIAPGSYRVNLLRKKGSELILQIEGAGLPLEASKANALFVGELSSVKSKQAKKLSLHWEKTKTNKAKLLTSTLHVRFGPSLFRVKVEAVDTLDKKGSGFALRLYSWPAELIESRRKAKLSTPIATLTPKKKPKRGRPAAYNLILSAEGARLVPLMSAPTDNFGFGPVTPPDPKFVVEGTAIWNEGQASKPAKQLSLRSFKFSKKSVLLELTCGKNQCRLNFALPGK